MLTLFNFAMKKELLMIFLQIFIVSLCSWGQQISINSIVGLKLHANQNQLPEFPDAWQLLSSPLLGFRVAHNNIPISLIYTRDFTYSIYNNVGNNPAGISNLPQKSKGDLLMLQYSKRQYFLGLGHYRREAESFTLFALPSANKISRLIVLSAGFRFNRLDIDYQRQIQYKPYFDPFDWGLQSINLRYNIYGKKTTATDSKLRKSVALEIRVGGRLSPVRQTFLTGETTPLLKISPGIGIDIHFYKINTSVLLDRDWWMAINGGSFERDIKGYVSNSTIGLCYHIKLQNAKTIKIGAGAAYVIDHNTIYETRTKINQGLLNRNLWYYNVKGLYISYYHPIYERWEIEFRQILPIVNEELFNPSRTSLGLIYKLKP